jgi:putative DNA primase/helicase
MIGYHDPIDAFRDAMADGGVPPPDYINPDGRLHRFRVEGDKSGSQNGWYLLHMDKVPAGAFGNWKSGDQGTWCAKSKSSMTCQDRANLDAMVEQSRRQRDAERTQKQGQAAWRAAQVWGLAQPAPADHHYLEAKRVFPHGIRQTLSGELVIPLWDGTQITSVQFISMEGEKRFLPGGKITGGWFQIGRIEEGKPVLIGEGFATCATLHQETGAPVWVAFTAGNLLAIARKAREAYPHGKIIVAGDNDAWTPGNPGATKARAAARDVGGKVLIPDFTGMDMAGKPTDWNDYFALRDQVRQEVVA